MATYQELLKQRAELEAQIQAVKKTELTEAITKVRAIVAEYELTAVDVFGGEKQPRNKGAKPAPKYRDPSTGATWTGRGKAPGWIKDKDRDQFKI